MRYSHGSGPSLILYVEGSSLNNCNVTRKKYAEGAIEYRNDDITIFFSFQRFGYHVLVVHDKKIHRPNLVGIGSWGPRYGRMNT